MKRSIKKFKENNHRFNIEIFNGKSSLTKDRKVKLWTVTPTSDNALEVLRSAELALLLKFIKSIFICFSNELMYENKSENSEPSQILRTLRIVD